MFDFRKYIEDRGNFILMSHLVSGYPSSETSKELAVEMIHSGVDILEVQIPFSDPLADGVTIMNACEKALDNESSPLDCFNLVKGISAVSRIPVVIMTYFNIIMNMGILEFVKDAKACGASGLIVPDLPLDSAEGKVILDYCREFELCLIPVVSPGMDSCRLSKVLSLGSGFAYATLKVGITGSSGTSASGSFSVSVKQQSCLPVVAGFGISSLEEVSAVLGNSDGIVIGSHLIRLLDRGGIPSVCEFVSSVSELIGIKRKAVKIETE